MKQAKTFTAIFLTGALLAGSLSGCGNNKNASTVSTTTSAVASTTTAATTSPTTTTVTPVTASGVTITLSGTSANASGSGVDIDGSVVTITKGGTYTLSGTLSDGRVIVNAKGEDVTLILSNADIVCSYGSPLYIYKSESTKLLLTDGTDNTLTDGSEYTFADSLSSATDEEPNACLYSKSDLVISGGGTLTPQEGEALSIPQALEVKARYVSNGDHVQAGDPIAQVDKAAVLSAISELQEVLDKLVQNKIDGGKTAKEARSSIRGSLTSKWKPLYLAAEDAQRAEIASKLLALRVNGEALYTQKDLSKWVEDAKKKEKK